MKRLLLSIILFILSFPSWACTSAVVSGKATPDGRPLLWKNRDSDFRLNHVAYVHGERYDFLADVNSATANQPSEAWIGTNSAGFAIMNTQTYNMQELLHGEERGDANGRVLFRALGICATVEDFCHLLDTIAKPSMIEANIGVIDAKGGAMMLEVNYFTYRMYDANTAPGGYVARTNYGFSGTKNVGGGYVRLMEAERVLRPAAERASITPQLICDSLSRSFRNNKLGLDLRSGICELPGATGWFVDQDFIPRISTSCSVVVAGVKKGEPASLTTMWTLLGYPPTGIMVPLWVAGGDELPRLFQYDEAVKAAPVSAHSARLLEHVFAYHQGSGTDKYLYWHALRNAAGTGYLQLLPPIEAKVREQALPMMQGWYKKRGVDHGQLLRFYQFVDEYLSSSYLSIN